MNNQDGRKFIASLTSRVVAVILMVAACCAVMAGYATSTYTLNVFADGNVIPVKTSVRNPQIIVEQNGITVGKDDKVDATAFKVGSDIDHGNAIIVYRAVPVTILEEGEAKRKVNAAGTVADALEKAGVTLEGADAASFEPETLLRKNMKIEVLRSYKIDLKVDGLNKKVDYAAGTVKDVLKRAGVELGEYDTVKPGLNKTLHPGSKITVKRISYETREEDKVIKFDTVTKTSGVLKEGTERVARKGQNGSKTITYEDKVVDGKVVSTKKVGEAIHVKPVSKVVVKGTRTTAKAASKETDTSASNSKSGPPTSYIKTFHGPATAYTAAAGARTASGRVAKRGLVAVNPKQIPYGSKLYIVADDGTVYGYATAADTGGFVHNGSGTLVDLYMDTNAQCVQWGRRNVTIYVLSWG